MDSYGLKANERISTSNEKHWQIKLIWTLMGSYGLLWTPIGSRHHTPSKIRIISKLASQKHWHIKLICTLMGSYGLIWTPVGFTHMDGFHMTHDKWHMKLKWTLMDSHGLLWAPMLSRLLN